VSSFLFTPALLRTYRAFVLFAVHKNRRLFLGPFISKASRRVYSFFLSAQLSQLYVATRVGRSSGSRAALAVAGGCRKEKLK